MAEYISSTGNKLKFRVGALLRLNLANSTWADNKYVGDQHIIV